MEPVKPLLLLVILLPVTCTENVKGKFLMINDIHYDPTYDTTGISCNVALDKGQRAKYGNYDCDASLTLLQSALYKADQESGSGNTDFIIMAGDLVTHIRKELKPTFTVNNTLDIINSTAVMLKQSLMSGIPILPMLGNHDYLPKDQLPADPTDKLYHQIADILCPLFLKNGGCTSFRESGFYSMVIKEKMKVVILNTNLYSVNNHAITTGHPDPAGQFDWLRNELKMASAAGQKVHVFAHIPPGFLETAQNVNMYKESYNVIFNKIMRDFASTIIGVYSGHTHTDSFRVIYSEEEPPRPLVPVLIAPSVTPWRWISPTGYKALARNPAIRSVHYTTDRMTLKDVEQFYLPLDTANSKAGDASQTVEWQQEYTFSKSYDVSDLSAQSLHDLATKLKKAGSDAFHKYFDLNSVSIHENTDKPTGGKYYCDCSCKVMHLCGITKIDHEDYNKCMIEDMTQMCGSGSDWLAPFACLPVLVLLVTLYNIFTH